MMLDSTNSVGVDAAEEFNDRGELAANRIEAHIDDFYCVSGAADAKG
jgi:hypothetical protein